MTEQVETRARRRIRQAVESRGYKLMSLTWEPLSNGGEKSGICGGWLGELDRQTHPNTFPGTEIMGLSVDETVAWVDEFVPPPEPCDCAERTYPFPMQSHEPTFMHDEGCRWRLRYWLRWWGPRPAHQLDARGLPSLHGGSPDGPVVVPPATTGPSTPRDAA